MKTLRATWAALAATAIPANAPATLRVQMENCFFGGANVVLQMLDAAAEADETGDALRAKFDELRGETAAFIQAAGGHMNGVTRPDH